MFDPFGWKWTALGWERVEGEQKVIARALELRDEGYSLRVAANIMNEEEWRSRGGKRIHPTQIARWERRSRD
jgi:hypothetical protein